MKRLLLTALLFGVALMGRAQNVPEYVSFQGRVVDAQGNNLGSPNPVNRTVIFRIYDGPSAGAALKFTEQQNVTIINGEFSVLIGQGTPFATEAKPVLSTVCDGSERYLGVTVKDPAIADANQKEIVPRQRFVTTPFAFRAKVAESVAAAAINGQIGTEQLAGGPTVISGATVQVPGAVTVEKLGNDAVTSAKISDGEVKTADLAGAETVDTTADTWTVTTAGAVTSAKLATGSVTKDKIAANAVRTVHIKDQQVTKAKLAPDASGFWETSGADAYRSTGKVGVGFNAATNLPSSLLQIGATPSMKGLFKPDNMPVMIVSPSNNGGHAGSPMETALVLARDGVAAQTWANFVRFDIGRSLPTSDAANSRTQLNIRLSQNILSDDPSASNKGGESGDTPTILSLRGDGTASFAGKITSPMFKVTEVIPYTEYPGTIDSPSTDANYVASGGTWLVTATTSGFRLSTSATLTATLKVNDVSVGQGIQYVLQNAHALITRQFVIRNKAAGTYKITWGHNGRSDGGDFQQVVIQELPY